MNGPVDGRAEVLALMEAMERRPLHVQHVARLALQLFDELAGLHGFGAQERLLLEAAALLHDLGHWPVAGAVAEGHHKESARLIRVQPWRHFGPGEIEIIAQVARYHRKQMPALEHDEFRVLPEWERRRVQRLAALLRLADAFDRTHAQYIQRVRVEVGPDQLVFRLEAAGSVGRELEAAEAKGDLARVVFQRDLLFEVVAVPGAEAEDRSAGA